MTNKTIELIKQKEGYRSNAYWDENAYRIGYGSDTMTDESGNIVSVTKSSTTTRAAAQRDLERRVPEFQRDGIIAQVGQDAWDALSDNAKAALTSLAYNYGSLDGLPSLVTAVKTGDAAKIAAAIEARAVDGPFANGRPMNAARRKAEAALVLSTAKSTPTYSYTSGGHPRDPDTGYLMSQTDPRFAEAVAARPPVPMPRSAAVQARLAAANANGSTATPKAPVPGLRLPTAPVSPAPSPGTGLSTPPATAPVAPGAVRTDGGIAGTVQMPAGARPSNIPAPRNTASGSGKLQDINDGRAAAQTRAQTAAPTTPGGLPLPAPLQAPAAAPSFKTISVLNPAYAEWESTYGKLQDIHDSREEAQMRAMGIDPNTGKPLQPAPAAPPKFLDKRVQITAAKPAAAAPAVKPAAAPVVAQPTAAQIATRQNDPTSRSASSQGVNAAGNYYNLDTNKWVMSGGAGKDSNGNRIDGNPDNHTFSSSSSQEYYEKKGFRSEAAMIAAFNQYAASAGLAQVDPKAKKIGMTIRENGDGFSSWLRKNRGGGSVHIGGSTTATPVTAGPTQMPRSTAVDVRRRYAGMKVT